MRPLVPRFVRWTVVLAMIAALTVAVLRYWGTSQYGVAAVQGNTVQATTAHKETTQDHTTQTGEWTQTPWGPLGPADRDLLVKIRQAGLYEGSTGLQAQRKAGSRQVRTIGEHISAEYTDLDDQVRLVAGKLQVPLPDQPTEQQRSWVRELSGLSGPAFDRTFAQRMRFAHGEALPTITAVRAGTRNDLIRSFAATAAVFVNRHMEYLERTGLVDYSTLPEPPRPPAGPEPRVNQVVNATPVGGANVLVAAAVYVGALLGIVGLLTLLGNAGLRERRTGARSARPRHAAARW